jgi:RNA-binding protein
VAIDPFGLEPRLSSESSQESSKTPPILTGGQRRHLRGLAHPLKPIVMIGEGGISDPVLKALDAALEGHELVKVRLRQPSNKKDAARSLAESTGAALCGVVGHTVVLYRPHPKDPKIQIPSSS